MRVVGVIKLNHMIANMMRCAGELIAQGIVKPLFEMSAPGQFATDPNILSEQVNVCVQIAHIQRQGVLSHELPDFVQ